MYCYVSARNIRPLPQMSFAGRANRPATTRADLLLVTHRKLNRISAVRPVACTDLKETYHKVIKNALQLLRKAHSNLGKSLPIWIRREKLSVEKLGLGNALPHTSEKFERASYCLHFPDVRPDGPMKQHDS